MFMFSSSGGNALKGPEFLTLALKYSYCVYAVHKLLENKLT